VLTGINLLGIQEGRWTQNVLTTVKFLGLGVVCAVGLFLGGAAHETVAQPSAVGTPDFGQAMILVLFVYGGWNEMAYVGAEVRNPRKNILRALVLGTLAVTLIYLAANLAFLRTLGFDEVRHSPDVAGEVLGQAFGNWSARFIKSLIAVSALGAIQGMIFTGARIYYAMGQDHRLYAWLGRWGRRDTPVRSLVVQAAITLALVVGFGWSKGGFSTLVNFTTPVFWIFFCLVAVSLFVLRRRRPQLERPCRVPLYPILPLIFCLSCALMIYASLSWAIGHRSYEALWAIALLAVGIVLSFWNR
jgi:amino acid transporter